MQNSQKRIAFDDFARKVENEKSYENYQKSLKTIVTRNAASRSLNRRLQEELKEKEILEKLQKVSKQISDIFDES